MKRFILLFLVVSSSFLYGQHFKVTHGTMRSWTSQSNSSQRGAEYRITIQALTKIKNVSISKIWISDKCYLIESLIIDEKNSSSTNQTISKGANVKIYINAKEVLNTNGVWELNNDECPGVPTTHIDAKLSIEYTVKGKPCVLSIKDVEPITPIQFD